VIQHHPLTVGGPEWEPALWWMVLASGGLHLLAIALLVLLPYSFLHHPPPLQSYTVDLVNPNAIGGNNMVRGGKGRSPGAPLTTAPRAEAPKPPPPKAETAPKEKVAVVPEKVKPPAAAPPKPAAAIKPPAPAAAEVQAEEAQRRAAAAKQAAERKAAEEKAAAARRAAEVKKAKAAAEARKAAEAEKAKEAAATRRRNEQIQAAVKRIEEQQGKRGAGSGTQGANPGGPISAGPGQGAGGAVKGVEYLLYYNQMTNRIKQSWAWAGTQTLDAVVGFNITDAGQIVNVRVTRSSGDPTYDASAVRAVRAANPLPPPPPAYRKEFSDVELTFNSEELRQ
jgi:colicin import membrane protein